MILGLVSFVLALATFTWSFYLYHYVSPDGGFTTIFQFVPAKPLVTSLFSVLGVNFLFASIMSVLIGLIFGTKK